MKTNSSLQTSVAVTFSASQDEKVRGSGYANAPVTKAPAWHGLVAWDMLLNGMTTGLFLVAAISELTVPDVFTSVAKAAYPVALLLLLVDLVLLVLDLGDPLRFHHMLRVFKLSAPISLGTWCLTIYLLPLTVAAAISLLPAGWMTLEWIRRLAVVIGLLPALGSAVYKGVLLSTNSQPGWKRRALVGRLSHQLGTLAGLRGDARSLVVDEQRECSCHSPSCSCVVGGAQSTAVVSVGFRSAHDAVAHLFPPRALRCRRPLCRRGRAGPLVPSTYCGQLSFHA